ncbi:MAG: HlyD family type I secretion periplasmic adaptor subunit [Geminicoccaceae bacterium]
MMGSISKTADRLFDRIWLRLRGGEAQQRFLSLSAVIEESATPKVLRFSVLLISLTVTLFLVWSAVAEVNETAKGSGVVLPNSHVRVVQHLEGGIVEDIAVREGEFVEKGRVLLRLSGRGVENELRQATIEQISLGLQAERLRAFIRDEQPNLSVSSEAFASMAAEQQRIFDAMIAAKQTEAEVIQSQLEQRRDVLRILRARRAIIERRARIAEDLHDRRKSLAERGFTSRVDYLDSEDRMHEAWNERSEHLERMGQAQSEVIEFRKRLASLEARLRDEANRELEDIETALKQNQETLGALSDRVNRLTIRAPVKGIVKGLTVSTIGEVIESGEVLMEVVPFDDQLVVEMRITPKDVGQVHQGQHVELKVSSFDFAKHGTVEGVLTSVSATTFEDDKDGEPYYLGRIALDRPYLGDDPNRNNMLPGMTVEAQIVTGSKTILAYLLKPIHKSLSSALSER